MFIGDREGVEGASGFRGATFVTRTVNARGDVTSSRSFLMLGQK